MNDNEILIEDIKTAFGYVTVCGPRWQLHGGTAPDGRTFNQGWKQVIGRLLYEPFATDIIDKLSFSTFLDVGAAFGYYSHYVKGRYPDVEVVAVECDHLRFGCLLRTSNGSFACRHLAIGTTAPELTSPGNLVSSHVRGDQPLLYCPLATLESLINHQYPPDRKTLVKLDIEGTEFEALLNSPKLAEHSNISWIIEAHRWKDEPQKLIDLFVLAGHKIHIIDFDINLTTLTFCATHQQLPI
jgi:FkbM family methyltransferase